MMTVETNRRRRSVPRLSPALKWAVTGMAFIGIQAWILGRWALHGDIRISSADVDLSRPRETTLWLLQGLTIVLVIAAAIVVVRGCRWSASVTFDAAILFGYFFVIWQNPLFKYGEPICLYNHAVLHFSSWGPYIPGWQGPDPHNQIEPALFPAGLAYPLMIVLMWGSWWMTDHIARRQPQWGLARLLLTAGLTTLAALVVIEAAVINLGIYTYSGAIQRLSLWGGHWYQIAITETFAFSFIFFMPIVLMRHYSRSNEVTPHIFQGTEAATGPATGAIRLLAGIGLTNTVLLAYMAFNYLTVLFGGPTPADTPSYFIPAR